MRYPDMILRSNDYYYDTKYDRYLEISSHGVLKGDFDRAIEKVIKDYNWYKNRGGDYNHVDSDRQECKCFVARYIDNFKYVYNGKYRSAFSYVIYLSKCFFKLKLKKLKKEEYDLIYVDVNLSEYYDKDNVSKLNNLFISDRDDVDVIYVDNMKNVLLSFISKLSEERQYIIRRRYGINCKQMSYRELARDMKVNHQNLFMKEKTIIRMLRRDFAAYFQQRTVTGNYPIGCCE
jgi:hypothetical protein